MAAAGDPGIKDKLLKGTSIGSKSGKVHLDGYNQLDLLIGKSQKGARDEFFYFNDDAELVAMRFGNWKAVFCEQRAPGGMQVWANPFTCLRLPKLFNLRMDPYERADVVSDQYYDFQTKNVYLTIMAQTKAVEHLKTYVDYPLSQLPAEFGINDVQRQINQGIEERFKKAAAAPAKK